LKPIIQQKEIYYPVLLFIVSFPFNGTRGAEEPVIAGFGRNSIWLPFLSLLIVYLGVLSSKAISKQAGGDSLMLASGRIGPRFMTPLAYILYAILFWGGCAFVNLSGGGIFSRTVLYGPHSWLVAITIVISSVLACFQMETLGRYAQFIFFFMCPAVLIIYLTIVSKIRWSYLYPVFSTVEMSNPLYAFVSNMLIFLPMAAVTLLIKPNHKSKPFLKLFFFMLFNAIVSSYMFMAAIGTLGVETAKQFHLPSLTSLSTVRLENFIIERAHFMGVILLVYFGMAASVFLFRCAAFCLAQAFGRPLSYWHIAVIGGTLLAFSLSINLSFEYIFLTVALGIFNLALLVGYPILVYLILICRGRRIRD
jgi:hypothetical protein